MSISAQQPAGPADPSLANGPDLDSFASALGTWAASTRPPLPAARLDELAPLIRAQLDEARSLPPVPDVLPVSLCTDTLRTDRAD